MRLKVGKSYILNSGDIVTIYEKRIDRYQGKRFSYFVCNEKWAYESDGTWMGGNKEYFRSIKHEIK